MKFDPPLPPRLWLRTLGELRLVDSNGTEPLAGRRKELALLVVIAGQAPHPVSRAELAAFLWGERPEAKARASLRQAVLRLKRALGDSLRIDTEAVALSDRSIQFDVTEFEAALAAERWADAVAQWRGDFLPAAEGLGGESFRFWLEQERERLRHRLAWAFERLIGDSLRRADHAAASRLAEQWCSALPLDERAHSQAVYALQLQGRIGDARARHSAFVTRHRAALDCEPSPEFLRLAAELEEPPASRPGATVPGIARRFTTPIVGRRSAFCQLMAAWEHARDRSMAVAIAEGPEGMGKTRLCEELLRALADRGEEMFVLRAAGGLGRREPWSLLRDLLSGIADAPGLLGTSPGTLAELSGLVPGLRERFAHPGEPCGDEWSIRDAVVEAVAAVASEVPVLVLVDDIGLADAESARLVLSLAARLGHAHVLLLVTTLNDYDARELGLQLSLGRAPSLWRIPLEPLDATEVELLLASIAELSPIERTALAKRLRDDVEGNPLFTLDTIAALIAEGYLTADGSSGWRASPALATRPLPVPPRMRAAVARRLERLSAEARTVAEAAALARGPLDPDDLCRLTGMSSIAVYAAVDELIAQRWGADAASSDRDRSAFTLTCESVRRAVALSVAPERRSALHRAAHQIGEAPTSSGGGTRVARRWKAILATAVLVLLGIGSSVAIREARREEVIAVGTIQDFARRDSGLAGAIADMLATNLARAPALQVVSGTRMLELSGQLQRRAGAARTRDAAAERAFALQAARVAGARQVVEGSIYAAADGPGLRLDLRRVDPVTGMVVAATSVQGASAFELVDRATAMLAASGGGRVLDTLRIGDVTTTSLTAYRLYQDGLRSVYGEGDAPSAVRMFRAALDEDSSFAMAAYELAKLLGRPGEGWTWFERAAGLASHASDRERLLIRADWALERNDPVALTLAETLAARYPNEPYGSLVRARAQVWRGHFLEALPYLRRVRTMDSLSLHLSGTSARGAQRAPTSSGSSRCLACDALAQARDAYYLADSLPAAVETATELVRVRPASITWFVLAHTLLADGAYAAAATAYRHAEQLGAGFGESVPSFYVVSAIRSGDFRTADRVLENAIRARPGGAAPADVFALHVVSMRHQGRLAQALRDANALRANDATSGLGPVVAFDGSIVQALVLFEMGRGHEAAALFDSIATRSAPHGDVLRSRAARHRAWMLTHAATARAAVGDTAPLSRLADSIETLGAQSFYGRDGLLHHHVRGLLLEARGRPDLAAREFRRAIYSPSLGYTRTNLELARCLLALRRPTEAVPVLRAALHGPLDASNMYVTRTELQAMLARAFDTAGQRDSARVYYRRVADAWRGGDQLFAARAREASARAQALQ